MHRQLICVVTRHGGLKQASLAEMGLMSVLSAHVRVERMGQVYTLGGDYACIVTSIAFARWTNVCSLAAPPARSRLAAQTARVRRPVSQRQPDTRPIWGCRLIGAAHFCSLACSLDKTC